jgi:hypothetical protein
MPRIHILGNSSRAAERQPYSIGPYGAAEAGCLASSITVLRAPENMGRLDCILALRPDMPYGFFTARLAQSVRASYEMDRIISIPAFWLELASLCYSR